MNEEISKNIIEIKNELKSLRNLIVGNGKIGIFSKVEIMWKGGIFVVTLLITQTVIILLGMFK